MMLDWKETRYVQARTNLDNGRLVVVTICEGLGRRVAILSFEDGLPITLDGGFKTDEEAQRASESYIEQLNLRS